ncbi:sulfite exporter TauE/SafE family protein [Myxococcota bacterium]|nr:sulfite exporter TauE/SafE family protein [Myxococcota bacterium]
MHFPISGVEVEPWVPPLVAFGVSFFTSMGGVSGAFLLLPFQVSVLGYTAPSVSATNQLFNIVAIPSGVLRYIREGRMLWPLTWTVVLGTLPGVLLGAVVRVTLLPDPGAFQRFAGLVLLAIGARMVGEWLPGARAADAAPPTGDMPPIEVVERGARRVRYRFQGKEHAFSTLPVLALSLAVGVVGGVYGIGGGAILAPFFVTIFRLPVHTVAGAALMGTFVTSIAGVAFYAAIAPLFPDRSVSPDWLLGLLFGLGGMAGMYLGARSQRHVPAGPIKAMLAAVLLFTAGKYLLT